MGPEIVNKNKNCVFNGPYAGRDLYITMYQDTEREFVVTHNANIKPVSYFTGRETELQELRQRIEEGRKSVLVSGMGGIGKTHICRKLFEEYSTRNGKGETGPFEHIGYIEYSGDMNSSLMKCLKYKEQDDPELNEMAAWRELEHLASNGKFLLFVDNVDKPIGADPGLQRLKGIPGAVVLTSRRTFFSKEFEPYQIGFLNMGQCREIYEYIRYKGSKEKLQEEEIPDLEYVIGTLAARHTITIEFLANLAETKIWSVKRLRDELQDKGFCLEYKDDEEKLVNIQKSYEALYDLSGLTVAEQNILEAFSLFPYIPLPAETCNEWLIADAGVGKDDDILVGLYRKGWLQFDMEQESYSMHPVFAQFIYEKFKPVMEKHTGLIEACVESINQLLYSTFECRPFIPFAISLFEKVDFRKIIVYNRFTDHIAGWFCRIEEYGEAEKWFRKSFDTFKEILGEYHPITLRAYINLAAIHEDLGNHDVAEMEYKKSLKDWEHVSIEKKDFAAIAGIYEGLISLYENQGRYDDAEKLYVEVLGNKAIALLKNQEGLAQEYHFYADRYEVRGKYDIAEKLYEKSLAIKKNLSEVSSSSVMSSYSELGEMYMRHGKYQKALTCFSEMVRILTERYSVNCSDIYKVVYKIMNNIYVKNNLKGNFEQWLEEQMKE